MSTLKLQIKEFQNQISLSSNTQENETIIEANSNVLKRLKKSLGELSSNQAKFSVMPLISTNDDQLLPILGSDERNGYLMTESSEFALGDDVKILLENAKEVVSIFSNKWQEVNYKAQQDDSLNDSIVGLRSFTQIISGLNDKYWDKWIVSLERSFVVEEVVLEQQTSLGKKEVYQKYNKLKVNFETEKLSRNVDVDLVSSLNLLREKLVKLREQMDRSALPEGVADFLKQLDAPWSTPTLDLVTPTVFDWLNKQGLLSKLKISRK
tara:strand:+ start:15846 stop:16643 length:798 start_codon:yes stop_codon:yes gene_type:complete